MKLKSAKELAAVHSLELHGPNCEISGVQLSSRLCEPGDLFIAIRGEKHHGIDHLEDAISHGAVAVLTDPEHIPTIDIPVLIHPDPKSVAGSLAAAMYETDLSAMQLFAVTGTNGKTSTITYLQQLLRSMGVPCGLSASTMRIVGEAEQTSSLTTPEVTELHRMLAQMRQLGQLRAAIEVSAQAMIRHRVDGIHFDLVGFTNLSRDHLDDFGSMDEYLQAKAKLFTKTFAKRAVVMVEDEYSQKLVNLSEIPTVTISPEGDYSYGYSDDSLVITGKASLMVHAGVGGLMAKNLALALVMLLEAGFEPDQLQTAVANTQLYVPGRLERVSPAAPAVFVDYAHTPAGVGAAVKELLGRYQELTVVLGASGNRDQGKREEMALSTKGATRLVITDQHPRDEDPKDIRHALIQGAASSFEAGRIFEIPEPDHAIRFAIEQTSNAGAVLWCGPGHLKYREVAGQKLPFDARAIAREAVEGD